MRQDTNFNHPKRGAKDYENQRTRKSDEIARNKREDTSMIPQPYGCLTRQNSDKIYRCVGMENEILRVPSHRQRATGT